MDIPEKDFPTHVYDNNCKNGLTCRLQRESIQNLFESWYADKAAYKAAYQDAHQTNLRISALEDNIQILIHNMDRMESLFHRQ